MQARTEAQRVFGELKTQSDHTRACIETIEESQRDMKAVLKGLEAQAAAADIATHILKSLQFPQMHDRRSLIHDSHPKTFSWIFESSVSPFRDWLRDHNGAFWVSGRAGSGKSTLMKHITQSLTTAKILREWAGTRELFTGSFYFWIAGSRMQKTQEGLLQSILYEILRQEPGLMPTVLRARWERNADFHRDPDPWTLGELYQVFDAVIHEKPKACFCFFIDGLDEFVGDAGQQGEFAERIQRLAQSPTVKLCVASRPWLPFDNVFGKDTKRLLVLEELTRDDMDAYVKSMLVENSRFTALLGREPNALSLVYEIRDKAQGVFLWVTLVVKSLLSGLTQHDDLDELTRRLHTLPTDLREFFRRMLDAIDEDYKLFASRILFLALRSTPLPLMTFWWVQVEAKETDYALRVAIDEIKLNPKRVRTAKNYLNKWSKDLLAVYETGADSSSSGDMGRFKIDYLHRTVGEFLKEPEVYDQLREQSGRGFDPDESLCRLLLAEAKTLRMPHDPQTCREAFQAIACRMVYHAKQYEIQNCCALKPLLRNLDTVIVTRLQGSRASSSSHWSASIRDSHVAKVGVQRATALNASSNLLAYAVANDLLEFVRETLIESPQALYKPGRPLLDFAIYPTFQEYDMVDALRDTAYLEPMVKLLLEHGSRPNQHANIIGSMTVWQMFLLDSRDPLPQARTGAWDVARLLLEHGADRQAMIPVEKMMDAVRYAGVEDSLSGIEGPRAVSEFVSRLPAPRVGIWDYWKRWFL